MVDYRHRLGTLGRSISVACRGSFRQNAARRPIGFPANGSSGDVSPRLFGCRSFSAGRLFIGRDARAIQGRAFATSSQRAVGHFARFSIDSGRENPCQRGASSGRVWGFVGFSAGVVCSFSSGVVCYRVCALARGTLVPFKTDASSQAKTHTWPASRQWGRQQTHVFCLRVTSRLRRRRTRWPAWHGQPTCNYVFWHSRRPA